MSVLDAVHAAGGLPEGRKYYERVGALVWADGGGTATVHLCSSCACLTSDPAAHDIVPCGPVLGANR